MRYDSLDRKALRANKGESGESDDLCERLDLRGLKCPLPALRVKKALARSASGRRLSVLADDPLAPLDLAHLCRAEGHGAAPPVPLEGGGWRFEITKGLRAAPEPQ
jgi:tRNA 2-thiouridine synthesizing protein A